MNGCFVNRGRPVFSEHRVHEEESLQMWEHDRSVAAAQGTRMHANVESVLNAGFVLPCSEELRKLFSFFADSVPPRSLTLCRTEFQVFASEDAGSRMRAAY